MNTDRRLTYPAPARVHVPTGSGTRHSHAWTLKEVLEYRAIGGWFDSGRHDYAGRGIAKFALMPLADIQRELLAANNESLQGS